MTQSGGPVYAFGPFRYDASQRMLFRDGEVVPLLPKVAETLQALLERRGRLVEKAELMKLVWPDTVVEDVGLARNISLLRKALGDEGEQGFIETVPRRGYRFRAEAPAVGVRPRRGRWPPKWPPRWRWMAGAALAGLGILIYWQFYVPSRYLPRGAGMAGMAVVPFEVLGKGADPALSQEFNEILVAEISKLNGVQVMSPSTVRKYQRLGLSTTLMARVLGLEVILEGTIQNAGIGTRITARLADVHSGKLIWAETYDAVGDPGKDTAQAVAAQVGAHLSIHGRFAPR